MANHKMSVHVLSENIEMYLVRVAQLRQDGQPVPISQLAHELAITPVSAHEMCRKLMERGLVAYEPYKGVTLTGDGELLAQRILRARYLWATFFSNALGVEPILADEYACRFEHVTPDEVANRLDEYLVYSENGSLPIGAIAEQDERLSLCELGVGEQAQITAVVADAVMVDFLEQQAVAPGNPIIVLGVGGNGALLLEVAGQPLALAPTVASAIQVKIDSGDQNS